MKRREFIALLSGAAGWPLAVRAQQAGKVWRIGVLSIGSSATAGHLVEAFFKGMGDLGYQEMGAMCTTRCAMAKEAWTNSSNTLASTPPPRSI